MSLLLSHNPRAIGDDAPDSNPIPLRSHEKHAPMVSDGPKANVMKSSPTF